MGIVIGISGAAGAGKDTVADFLVTEHGFSEKLSFARNLKNLCKTVFFLTEFDVNDQEGKMKLFSSPVIFTDRNLGSVMFLMARTHSSYPVLYEAKRKVKDLVGTELVNPRHILQFIGTDICRELVPTYHSDVILNKIKENLANDYVISDVRFPNEGNIILDDLGGKVVLLKRCFSSVKNIDSTHSSETAMLKWGRFTASIDNSREGLHFLYEATNNFLRKYVQCQNTQL